MKRPPRPATTPGFWLLMAAIFMVNCWVAAVYGQRLLAGLALVTALSALWAAARPGARHADARREYRRSPRF